MVPPRCIFLIDNFKSIRRSPLEADKFFNTGLSG
jgi:hypothetical protein